MFSVGWTPYGGEYLFVGDDPAGIAGQTGQQLEFLRRKLDLLTGARHPVTHVVDLDVRQLEDRGF